MSVILNFEEEKIFRHWLQTSNLPPRHADLRAAYEAGVAAERKRVAEEAQAEEVERRDRAIYS